LLALVVAGAAFAAVVLLGGGGHNGGGSGGGSPGAAVQLNGVGDAYSNAGHPDSHADTAGNATDVPRLPPGETQTYGDQAFGGLLTGLGLVLDAGSAVKLAHLTVTTPTPGFTAEIQSGDSATGPFTTDSSSRTVNGTTTFTLNGDTAQYYVVWITQLPPQRYARDLGSNGDELVHELRAALVPLERELDQPVERLRVAEARRLEEARPDARRGEARASC
jgi:hypothetical protein